ncbi:helix-turn-helix domain-containing protein [Kribbella sp. CA-253562]|uniref:helix-turn-helix domain-containing protein n=1 Tax=Kribbella sp. CA-253562 TaxID=3239942 RepID=UPI003D8FCB23
MNRPGFGQLLRGYRTNSGLTQERLAERSGLSIQAISALESGRRRRPRPITITLLADSLGLSSEDRRAFAAAARHPAAGDPGRQPAPKVAGSINAAGRLPSPPADFTGRSRQLDELTALLKAPFRAAPGIVVSAIGGMGGVGKTALAVQAAHLATDVSPDGQLYLNLGGGTRPLTVEEALAALLQLLGVPADGSTQVETAAARYRSALAGRQMLIVLDDAASVEQVTPLMPGVAGVVVLVTSRRRLTELPGALHLELDVMDETEAIQLLGRLVGTERIDQDPDAARDVVRRCGLLPLAIRIAGSQVDRMAGGLRELADRLVEGSERLRNLAGSSGGVGRSISLSLTALAAGTSTDRAAAEVFAMLSVFEGDRFPLRAAAAVLGRRVDETENLLERLVDSHLLETPALHQYRMHDLVRVVAVADAERRFDGAARERLRRRETDCYLAMLWRFDELMGGPDKYGSRDEHAWSTGAEDVSDAAVAADWLDAELPNLVRLVRRSAQGDSGEQVLAVRMALGMPKLASRLMRFGETHQALKLVVDLPVELDLRVEVGRKYQLGFSYSTLGLYRDAVPWRERALPLARELGDPWALAAVLIDLGYNLGRSGRAADGLPYAEEALIVTEHPQAAKLRVGALVGLGALAGWLGDVERQRIAFEEAIARMPERSSPGADVVHRNLIGHALTESGQHHAAVDVLTENLGKVRELGTEVIESDTLEVLGLAWLALGEHARARKVLADGVKIAVRYPTDHREGRLRHHLGRALTGLGLVEEARRQWELALIQYQLVADVRADEVRRLLAGSAEV